MVGHGFGGFGSGGGGGGEGAKSPQEHKYFAISRSGVRPTTGAAAVVPRTASAGKRGVLRRSSLTPAATLSLSGLEATPTGARRAMQAGHTGSRTPRRARGRVRTSDVMFDGEDCSASAAASSSSVVGAHARAGASDSEDEYATAAATHCTLDDAEHVPGIDNDRDSCAPSEEVSCAGAAAAAARIAALEHALEEAHAARESALAKAAERQAVCDALLGQVEGLRRRYFNALCLAVKLDRAAGAGACVAQDQQDLYDAAKLQGVSVDDYPAWVVRHLTGPDTAPSSH